jgi:uncharacterized protein YjbI with pentapeptide repeats
MQILKPQALGLSTRPIEFRKRYGLSISAYLHLPFAQGERGCLWAEQSMWSFLAREMAQPLIDEGVVKLTPEFLVHGHAFAPEDRPNACAVRARLGTREKTLLVFGDRYWDGARPSTPRPFASMPLGWAAAYGGADFAANPQGKGREARDGVTWLPNIELPGDRLLRPDQAVAPAGFGALDLMNPQRARHRGTYDADYLQQHAPGFAPDTDWRFFNLAPSDQWMGAALAGDERFAFDNMHPSRPLVEGRLPGMRARVFVGYRVEGSEPKVREVPLRLTTVWFFPHAERCIAIFQGLAEVGTDDGSDVLSLMGAVERNGEARTDQHYLDAAARRADPRTGALYAIVDSDLLPAGVSTADPDVEAAKAPFAMAGLQGEAQRRRAQVDVELARQKARDMGQDPDALGIRMPPREEVPQGDALPAYLEKVAKDMEAQQWAAVEDAVTALEKAYAMSARQKIDLGALKHRGPPLYKADRHLADLRAQAAVGSRPPDLAPLLPKLRQLEDTQRQGYLETAHMQPPAFAMPAAEAAALRQEMPRAMAAGIRFFAGIDFTGADFSGLDLRDVNFQGAWLESADLRNANLSGADFTGAVLAHAKLEGAICIGAKFGKANLGKAALARGVFDDADFSEAVLMRCAFAGTQMRRALLQSQPAGDHLGRGRLGRRAAGGPDLLQARPARHALERGRPVGVQLHRVGPVGRRPARREARRRHLRHLQAGRRQPPDGAVRRRGDRQGLQPGRGRPGRRRPAALQLRRERPARREAGARGARRRQPVRGAPGRRRPAPGQRQGRADAHEQLRQRAAVGRRLQRGRAAEGRPARRRPAAQQPVRGRPEPRAAGRLDPLRRRAADPRAHLAAPHPRTAGHRMTPTLLALAVRVGETLEGLDLGKGHFAKLALGGGVFSRVRFAEADLREADLREAVFDQCDLRGAIASGANLRRAVFNRCLLDHADLRQANLHGAVFTECDLQHAQFAQAALTMATLSKCRLAHANLRGAQLGSAVFTQSVLLDVCADDTDWPYTTVNECDLSHLTWAGARMQRNVFFKTSLKGMSFAGLALDGCQFSSADLSGADFSGVVLRQCNFQGAKLDGARFVKAVAPSAIFCEAAGQGADFTGAGLRQALFTGAALPLARFAGCDLHQAHFAGAKLQGADFTGAELTYADFRHADLGRADLRRATLRRTVLHGANTTDAQMTDRASALESDPELAASERWQPLVA